MNRLVGVGLGWGRTDQVTNEEKSECWELEETNGRVTQVKPDNKLNILKEPSRRTCQLQTCQGRQREEEPCRNDIHLSSCNFHIWKVTLISSLLNQKSLGFLCLPGEGLIAGGRALDSWQSMASNRSSPLPFNHPGQVLESTEKDHTSDAGDDTVTSLRNWPFFRAYFPTCSLWAAVLPHRHPYGDRGTGQHATP